MKTRTIALITLALLVTCGATYAAEPEAAPAKEFEGE